MKSTRVWRRLAAETAAPCPNDSVLRIALMAWALDAGYPEALPLGLSAKTLGQRTTPFTPEERAALQGPLLGYVEDRLPTCLAIVRQQFAVATQGGQDALAPPPRKDADGAL